MTVRRSGKLSRRQLLKSAVKLTALAAAGSLPAPVYGAMPADAEKPVLNVLSFGAVGNGVTADTKAIQQAIDAAAAKGGGARVLLPAGHRYLTGPLTLKSHIDFHVETGAEILISTDKGDYTSEGVFTARDAEGLQISGGGRINGQARAFMSHYDQAGEWWIPKDWRPRLFILTGCSKLVIKDITIEKAPSWTIHLVGCKGVLIRDITIRNDLDVPNSDGIDPDHCQDVDIRGCHITCGDDAIVIKTTRAFSRYGPSAHIRVRDCVLETQDSGLKIGTETVQDIYDVVFERCRIVRGCRGLTIQLRDEGSVHHIVFRHISFTAQYFSAPWWGRGEAISLTAIPRRAGAPLGSLHHVSVEHVRGRSENSVRICGSPESRTHDILFSHVSLRLGRWTSYQGGVFDNRPTSAYPDLEAHDTPGFYVRYADGVVLNHCAVSWEEGAPDYFSYGLEACRVTGLKLKHFKGTAAHPERDEAVVINQSSSCGT